jgi:hypothetical protein
MRKKVYLLIFVIFWWYSSVGASYAPMPPSILITESEIIAVGRVTVKDTLLTITVENALKGNVKVGDSYSLLFPEYVPYFEKKLYLEKFAGTAPQKTIVLGRLSRDQNHSMLLINSIFSLWPQGLDSTVGSISFDESKDLVEFVIRYENLKNDPDKLINELFYDISRGRFISAVGYSQNRLQDVFTGRGGSIRKQILGVAFSKFLNEESGFQGSNNEVFLNVSDSLPQTLAIPWLINIAKSKSTISDTAISKLIANFRTRHLVSSESIGIDEIALIFNQQRQQFLDYDFKQALEMLNSEYQAVRANSVILLGKLLGLSQKAIEEGLSRKKTVIEIRDFWQKIPRKMGKCNP